MSKASGSDDEPLVPDDFDDDFFQELGEKIPEVSKTVMRNSDNILFVFIGYKGAAPEGYAKQCGQCAAPAYLWHSLQE